MIANIVKSGRAALQWRLLLLWVGCLLVPTGAALLPVWRILGASLDYSVHAASLARELDLIAIADLAASVSRDRAAVSFGALVALGLTLLLSPLLSGMAATAARAEQPPGFAPLLAGAVQEYPRMFRMLLWAVVPLGLAAALGNAALKVAQRYAEQATLQSGADIANLGAVLLFGLLLMAAHATLDAGRATLAADRRRRSALRAWWDGCKLLARRPGAALGAYLAISLGGLALAAPLGIARLNVAPAGALGFIAALTLTQLVVLVLAWMRSARLFALIALAAPHRG